MQRRAYVPGAAALLAALLAGCTGSSGSGSQSDNSNPGSVGTASPAAQPGRYATLPEPCGAVGTKTLDELLPGIREMADQAQREKAYAGEATLTYDTDRKVGCRWKVESSRATDRLVIDLERVVSYDNAVSDDNQAQQLFATKQEAADLPKPAATESGSVDPDAPRPPASSDSPDSSDSSASLKSSDSPDSPDSSAPSDAASSTSGSPSGGGPSPASPSTSPSDLRPRVLGEFGDEAFIDDELSSSGSTTEQRTVTVAFRTSNVIVTVEYTEQPATVGAVPDSKEMQDRARKVASLLADSLSG